MLTIVVCDDQEVFIKKIYSELNDLCARSLPERLKFNILTFSSARELLNTLQLQPADILFLDIEMPDISGFRLADQLRTQFPELLLIFVSSYEDYVYQSFSYSPFWFLRKSHIKQELPGVFQRAVKKYLSTAETMIFQTKEGEVLLRLNDIVYLESVGNYYNICCSNGNAHKCRGTLTSIGEILQKYDFVRVHAAYCVNLAQIQQVYIADNMIRMKSGKTILISRQRLSAFKMAYTKFTHGRFVL